MKRDGVACRRTRRVGVVLALLLAGAWPANAGPGEGPAAPPWPAIDDELRALQVERGLPGLSVAIARGSKVVFAQGYGCADCGQGVPVTPATIFPIASIEKEFTASAVMRLAERGKLSIDDPVTKYLPELDTGGAVVTLRDMLQQVSGLQETGTAEAWQASHADSAEAHARGCCPRAAAIRAGKGFEPAADIALFRGVPLYHAPRERWTYSQPNYDLMCYVLANATGRTYYDLLAEVAGAAGVAYYPRWTPPPPPDRYEVALGYRQTGHGPEPFREENTGSGWTSAVGLVRWAHALESGAVVSRSSYEAMTRPVRLKDGRTWFYGMGLVLNTFEGHRVIEHTGNISGFTSVLAHFPDDDLTIAVMSNLGFTLAVSAIQQRLAREILGLEEPRFRDLPVREEDRRRFAGVYDAGGFWFEILDEGGRLSFRMREPDGVDEPAVYFSSALRYQGDGHFVGEREPDVLQVWFDQPGARPGEMEATIAGAGWRPQAVRLEPASSGRR